jgi:membrane-associated phospholipid phosphatase
MSRESTDATASTVRLSAASRLYHFDWIVIGYCALMVALLLLFGRPLRPYWDELAFYTGAGIISVIIARRLDERNGGWEAFFRLLYPAMLFTFFYRETGGLMHLLHPEFRDAAVVAFEKKLLGVNPTLYFDQHWLTAWRSEILMFCYGTYYLMLPAFSILVFLRRDYGVIREVMAATALTFFVSYTLFFLYPVAGPRWHFAAEYLHPVQGPVFTNVVQFIMSRGAVLGGAMPSSHTGVALVVLIFCYRYYRKIGFILTPIVLGLSIGAVWGRFHYFSDIVVGAAIGAAAVAITWRYFGSGDGPRIGKSFPHESEAKDAS